MKQFAITPDELAPAKLITCLPVLQRRSVSHLYLRAQSLHADLEQLVALIQQHAIMPIIPRSLNQAPFTSECGIHTRSSEDFVAGFTPAGILRTAACHNIETACALLDKGADYVFISPVYRPFSKLGDQRLLITTDALRIITRRYGSRIVLLGGLTQERIKDLHTILDTEFSVAGISMFFNTGTTHEQAST